MQRTHPFIRLLLLPLMLLLASIPARAIIGGDGIDPNSPDSPWAGVGSITIDGGTYSGALISRRHVLTAAHVVQGHSADPGDITFNINYGGTLTYRIKAAAVYLFPDYRGTKRGQDGVWHDDIAIIELEHPVPASIPVYPIYQGIPGITDHDTGITFVGYGAGKDSATGLTQPPDPGVKRVGRNRIGLLMRNPDGHTGFDLFLYRFLGAKGNHAVADGSQPPSALFAQDAIFAGGDSGSPVFIRENGTWKIMGVATFATALDSEQATLSDVPALAGGTLVAPFAGWISEATAHPQSAPCRSRDILSRWGVPAAAGTTAVGLLLWLAYRRYRRRRAGGQSR